jgi:hypothetical protein
LRTATAAEPLSIEPPTRWAFIWVIFLCCQSITASKTSTFDIDLQFEVQPEHHTAFIRCLRQLSRQLKLPIEQASPEQFMPLPKGYQDRHRFIGRYGLLDLWFSFISIFTPSPRLE